MEKFTAISLRKTNLENYEKELKNFVMENFEADYAETSTMEDFEEITNVNEFITDEKYEIFYKYIHEMWKNTAAKTQTDIKENKSLHSIIYLPNTYIATGEFNANTSYEYFESYWIVRGLLANKMYKTAAGIIRNFAYLADNYMFVPYTNRIYALTRTQLPLLALMTSAYIKTNKEDDTLLGESMDKEFRWWEKNRMIKIVKNGKSYKMFHYHQSNCTPRPENYREDFELAAKLNTDDERKTFFSELHSLNESGFGFTTRFLRLGPYSERRLNLDVSSIIPVELNCVLYKYANLLSRWFGEMDETQEEEYYANIASDLLKAIKMVLRDDFQGAWFDWDMREKKNVDKFYITNLMPIFTESYEDSEKFGEKVLQYLISENIITEDFNLKFYAIPTTTQTSTETWDYPFGSLLWNTFIIEGLYDINDPKTKQVAKEMARMLIKTTYDGFRHNQVLYEKYIVLDRTAQGELNPEKVAEKLVPAMSCVIVLLRKFGLIAQSTDYNNFQPQRILTTSPEHEMPVEKKRKVMHEKEIIHI